MSDESARRIEERLHRIERRLEIMEYRLQAVEVRRGIVPPAEPVQTGPRPVVFDMTPAPPVEDRGYFVKPPPPISAPPPVPERQEDAEYRIGAQLMPRVGAAAVIAGIGYLVSLGYTRG